MPTGDGMVPTMDGLHIEIAIARQVQLQARIACAHSANVDTIAAEKLADRELDVKLDRLLLRLAARTT
jgi:hypothetical protein